MVKQVREGARKREKDDKGVMALCSAGRHKVDDPVILGA